MPAFHPHPFDQLVTHFENGVRELQGVVIHPASQFLQVFAQLVRKPVIKLRELNDLRNQENDH